MALRYVDPAAAVGGDGTTLGLSGANAAYVSLNVWEAARQASLSEPEEVQCAGSSADTTAVVVDGWTTSAANYILITSHTASRHAGTWNSGIYRLETSATADALFITQENYTRLYALQCSIGHALNLAEAITGDPALTGIGGVRFERNIVRATIASTAVALIASHTGSAVAQNVTANNLVYGFSGTGGLGIYARSAGSRHLCYNNTAYNCATGIRVRDTQTQIKNNMPIGCTDAYLMTDAAESGSTNNGYDEGSDPAASGIDLSAYSDAAIFVDATNGDFHLASSSPAKDVGADLSSDTYFPLTEDIDGDTRSGSWDIGADEVIASAAYGPIVINLLNS